MNAPLVARVPLEGLTAARLWSQLDPPARLLGAEAVYARERSEPAVAAAADAAVARALRFRPASVRKLPPAKRAAHLARLHVDEMLASALLHALHLEHRRPLLRTYLDALGIAHQDGLIDGRTEVPPPPT